MATITDIEGIGEVYAVKLRTAGVRTTEALLKRGGTPKERKELAEMTGFSEQTILEWVPISSASAASVHNIPICLKLQVLTRSVSLLFEKLIPCWRTSQRSILRRTRSTNFRP